MSAVDVDCNRRDSPVGRAHTRLVNRKAGFTRIPRIFTKGKRPQSKKFSQKDENSFISHFLDPIFLTKEERKEHTAGRNSPDFTEGNKGNKAETGTGFLQEAAEVAENKAEKLYTNLHEQNGLVNRRERKEHRASTEGNKGNKASTGTGFLQEEAEKAESGWRKRRFFAAWTSFPLSFSPLTSAFFAFSAVKQSPSFPLFASVQFFSPPFVPSVEFV